MAGGRWNLGQEGLVEARVGRQVRNALAGRSRSVNVRSACVSGFLITFMLMSSIFAGTAQAAPKTIAEFGEGAGKVNSPDGAAIRWASGDLYIADRNNFRINKYDAGGNFILAWGWGVRDGLASGLQTCGPQASPPTLQCTKGSFSNGPGGIAPSGVAVDQASGSVYVVSNNQSRISKFSSSGAFLFMIGRNVNETKVGEGGATQLEKNICTAASGDTCGDAESGTGVNEFDNNITTVSVDPTGIVWVGLPDRLVSFDASGIPGDECSMPGAGKTLSLALDSAGNFFLISESLAGVRKLKLETGTCVELETLDAAGKPRTVTLDVDDNVYVGDETDPYRFKVYNPVGEQISEFGANEVIGAPGGFVLGGNAIAVDKSNGKLYAASMRSAPSESVVQAFPLPEPGPLPADQHVEELLPTTATLTATLNPEGDQTTYHFEWGINDSYGQSTPTQTLSGSAFDAEVVEAPLEELTPGTTYHFRLVATNHCNPSEPSEECTVAGPDTTFQTPPAVLIDPQWATGVTSHSAILHAELEPFGVEAEAWLEYGTSQSYGQVVPLANLGEGLGPVMRHASLTGLQSATIYHFRFVARDERDGEVYTVQGQDRTFTTQFDGLGFELADKRVWEMVSPASKRGAKLVGGGEITLQASDDGDSLAYQSRLSIDENPEGNRALETSMALARRDQEGSWSSTDITPFNDRVTGIAVGNGTEYKLFNSDLSQALLEPRSGTPLSVKASERTPYLRESTNPPTYEPLVTGKAPFANVSPDIKFGGDVAVGEVAVAGSSPDFQHFALKSDVPLIEGASISGPTIYEWSDGQIKPVSVLPADEGGELAQAEFVGSGPGSIRGAISEDGSRVFWSTGSYGNTTALYVRDTEAGESVRLDVPQGGLGGASRPVFQGASADGTVVFFTDQRRLTENAGSKGFDLYRCELPPGSVASGCASLTNISVPIQADESAEVEGVALGVTEDARAIYFVARAVLDHTLNDVGDSAVVGAPNLYLWRQGQGVRFVATLAEEDRTTWGVLNGSTTLGVASQLAASASPSGRYLAFMSQRSLTGYDNRDANTGEPVQELFRYDALADQLECVSCNPAETRPQGIDPPQDHSLVNPLGLFGTQQTAAILPLPLSHSLASGATSLYRPRVMLDNGRVFFNAVDPLVPADSNGQWDVYQYEPTGVGDCLASSGGASIARSTAGCVSLLSSGTAEEEAAFVDASGTGDDAFFFTAARLSVLDEDREVDIYDARVDGEAATLSPDTECLGEACQPPPQAPSDPTPASAAFQGPGNVRPAARKKCPKGKRRVQRQGQVRCVSRKKRRPPKGQQGQRKAGGDRRVTR